jgi:hypothetical protein
MLPTVCAATASSTTPHGKAGEACVTTCFEGDSCSIGSAPVASPAPGGVPQPQPQPQPDPVGCYRDDGLFCDLGLCAPLVALGAPCDSFDACRGTAFCDFDTGLCTAPQPDGSPCESSNSCQSHNCSDTGPVVDPNVAVPRVCVSAATATAQQCENDFSTTDSTSPGDDTSDPGARPPTP